MSDIVERLRYHDCDCLCRMEVEAAGADEIERLRTRLTEALSLVSAQAEDDGLWFEAVTASEAYLQQELRRLHAVIEGEKLERIPGLGMQQTGD